MRAGSPLVYFTTVSPFWKLAHPTPVKRNTPSATANATIEFRTITILSAEHGVPCDGGDHRSRRKKLSADKLPRRSCALAIIRCSGESVAALSLAFTRFSHGTKPQEPFDVRPDHARGLVPV